MFKEPPMTLALESRYQKHVLRGLHPNVHIQRHGGFFWTHHEKIVVIDRKVAFIGE
jgi:phospholipase D1/2